MSAPHQRIVLAYSGGLDTSVILHWLKKEYGAEIIAFTADLGQQEELDGLEEKGLKTGAEKVVIGDLREELVKDFFFPALKANAVYEGVYLLGTSIARPVIAKAMVNLAREHGATALSHGATGKGNDQVRFELTAQALAPELETIAPWRTWTMRGREDLIAYAQKENIPITVTPEKPYSMDRNILHISYEGGVLEDPWHGAPDDLFLLTKSPQQAPDAPEELIVGFQAGEPVSLNGEPLAPVPLMEKLNLLAGKHGIGRVDLVENRFVGMKSRGVYEAPAATVLLHAHRAVESLTLDREAMFLKDSLVPKVAQVIYNGFWYSPEMRLLMAAVNETQQRVTGDVRLVLYKGNVIVSGRRSPHSLYDATVATFGGEGAYNQADATGFIRLQGLRLRTAAGLEGKEGG